MRWLILSLAAIPAFALWAWVVFIATSNGWWREPLAPPGDTTAFAAAVSEAIDAANGGNAAFRLIDGGDVAAEHYVSIGDPVDADSRFQAGSLSKWLTAWGVMKLVEAGELDLDTPVATHLTRWELPESPFDNDGVTARRLLSHTAGLTDGLGYHGFPPGAEVQRLEDSLTHADDALEGVDGRVRVGMPPGSEWRYSGGGYALLQLVVEEVTGEPFASYMSRTVLDPLGLQHTTFGLDGATGEVATLFGPDGVPVPHHRFSAPAAAALYTSAADMTRFIRVQLPGPAGEPPGRSVLEPATLNRMREPHASTLGTDVWGLGCILYADNGAGGHVVGHDGQGRVQNASVRFDPATGDGIVLLVTGNGDLATRLAGEWVFWHTGQLDIETFYRSGSNMITVIAIGWVVIVLMVLVLGWLATRRRGRGG